MYSWIFSRANRLFRMFCLSIFEFVKSIISSFFQQNKEFAPWCTFTKSKSRKSQRVLKSENPKVFVSTTSWLWDFTTPRLHCKQSWKVKEKSKSRKVWKTNVPILLFHYSTILLKKSPRLHPIPSPFIKRYPNSVDLVDQRWFLNVAKDY